MRVLTFNCWHGLSGLGTWRMGELEPTLTRQARLARQVKALQKAKVDLIFLQEVNPLLLRVRELVGALKMPAVHHGDLTGVKFFGYGPPFNLDSGLAILASPELKLKKLGGIQLSGPRWGLNGEQLRLQTSECRFALLSEISHPSLGSLLLVNVHLHHGIEADPRLVAQIEELHLKKVISDQQLSILRRQMEEARARRLGEIDVLFRALENLRPRYDGMILGGDLNSEDNSAAVGLLEKRGLKDVYKGDTSVCTWDADSNHVIFEASRSFHLPLSDFGIEPLEKVILDYLYSTRRIDYIFVNESLATRVKKESMFGANLPVTEMHSDHFGLLASIDPPSRVSG